MAHRYELMLPDELTCRCQGKGYPDMSTRAMARFLWRPSPRNGFMSPPIYGLMDYDPDGMAIFSTYKNGSALSSEEKDGPTIPNMHWLGLRRNHISDEQTTHQDQGLMALTRRDRHKARSMIDSSAAAADSPDMEWNLELQVMLMLNLKAELQLLDALPNGLSSMVQGELLNPRE